MIKRSPEAKGERCISTLHAVYYLVERGPALVWSPSHYVTDMLQCLDWSVESVKLLYDKTPWDKELLQEHVEAISEVSTRIDDDAVRKILMQQALKVLGQIGDDEVIYAGSIYSVKARRR